MPLRTFLLVDDEPIVLRLASLSLRAAGCARVHAVATSDEALATAARERPDVVILDVRMPDRDGPATLAALRELPGMSDVPVIFMTALDDAHEEAELLRLGARGVIRKPFDLASLAQQIAAMLGDPPPPRASPGIARDEAGCVLHDRLRDLEAAFDVMRSARGPEPVARVQLLAHRLRGSAALHGAPMVGAIVGRIDEALRGWAPNDPVRRAAAEGIIRSALDEARCAVPRAGKAPSVPALNLDTTSLLLVDRDAGFATELRQELQRVLVRMVHAGDEESAVAVARAEALDAAIIDVDHGSGEEPFRLAEHLRAEPGNADLPIAFVGAAPSTETRLRAVRARASLFVEKPVSPQQIATFLERLRSTRQLTGARALVIDDDDEFVGSLTSTLEHAGLAVRGSAEPTRVHQLLEEVAPDVLFLDVEMPGLGGFDLCRMLRMSTRWQDLPIFFVSGHDDLDARLEAFAAGATDYFAKPIIAAELLARVRARLQSDAVLQERADRDPLTHLLSRRAFLEALAVRASEARRHDRSLAVCILDLDRFKSINDTFGHLVGDRVLAAVGRLLASRFRAEDLRARWGGEEFVLALPGVDAAGATAVLSRVLDELAAVTFTGDDGETFSATFSAGVAELERGGDDVEAAMRLADKRLYMAKSAGRARVIGP